MKEVEPRRYTGTEDTGNESLMLLLGRTCSMNGKVTGPVSRHFSGMLGVNRAFMTAPHAQHQLLAVNITDDMTPTHNQGATYP